MRTPLFTLGQRTAAVRLSWPVFAAIALPVAGSLLLPTYALAQANQAISGRVTSKTDNEGLPGVTILQKGTSNGVSTNADGSFILNAPVGSTLIISSIGFSTQEVTAGAGPVNVALTTDSKQLNDVVVVGYGTVKKSDLTGSVASLKREELLVGTPLSIDRGLQGKVAGVQVTQNDGAPGSGISMQIRGVNSFGSNTQPLYVIDGVPLEVNNDASTASGNIGSNDNAVQTTNALNFLRPSDIESIEVLKDASATAIYGSRGANGVVIVTTRRGQTGQDRVDVSFRSGFDRVAKKIKVLDAETYATYLNEKFYNSDKYYGTTFTDTLSGDFQLPFSGRLDLNTGRRNPLPADFQGRSTDWQKVIFQNAPVNEASVTFSGASAEKGSFVLAANYIRQSGIIVNSAFEQGNFRVNVNRNLTKWLTFETNTQVSRSLNKLVKTASANNEGNSGVIYSALRYAPTATVDGRTLLANGEYVAPSDQLPTTNPLTYINDVKNQNLVTSVFSSNSLVFNVLPGLQLRTRLGLNYYTSTRNVYYPRSTFEGQAPQGSATVSGYNQFDLTSENIATYSHKFGEKHELTAVAGYTFTNNNYNTSSINATGFLNDALQDNSLGLGKSRTVASSRGEAVLLSYLSRVNYNLNGKYLFTLSGRIDGSSKFAKKNKYASFGAAAFAWRAVDEAFIRDLDVFSDLKLRLSYGTSGNQAIGSYESLARLAGDTYVFAGQLANAYYIASLASPNLTWETTYQADAGIDIGLLKGRLTLSVDAYDKQTKNLLQNLTLPSNTGFNSARINAGQVQNRGLEISLSGRAVDGPDFKWTPAANISFNRNKIIELGAGKERDFSARISSGPEVLPFILQPGQPIGRVYGYVEQGIFQSVDEVMSVFPAYTAATALSMVGEIRYRDLNGDGVIDSKDQQVIGNVNPKFVGGFTNTFNYKKLDLTVFIQGSYGNDLINYTRVTSENLGATRNNNITQEAWDNRWTETNRGGTNRKAVYADAVGLKFSDRFVEDGSFVRLKNLSLGYNFLSDQYGIRTARFFVSLTNLYTLTNYKGYDPEVNAYGQNSALRGVDLGNYPTARSFSAGINVGF